MEELSDEEILRRRTILQNSLNNWKRDLERLLEHLQRCEAAGMPGFPFMYYFPDWVLEELSAAGYTVQLRRACGHYVFLPRNPRHKEIQNHVEE